jgi:class 3 adenylate cyclase
VTNAHLRYTQTSDGADIAYAVVGDGPPVVIAGPFTGAGLDVSLASEPYMSQFDALRGYSLVLFDWRGLGASGPAPAGFTGDGFVADLAAVVATVDAPTVAIFGQLYAAHAAATFAAAHPDRVNRLALSIRPAPHSPRTSTRFRGITHLADEDWPRFAELYSLNAYGWIDAELVRVQHARMTTQLNAEKWHELNDAVEQLDAMRFASQLTMPTLVRGAPDTWPDETQSALRRFVAALPDGRLGANRPERTGGEGGWLSLSWLADFLGEGRLARGNGRDDPRGLQTLLFTDVTGSTAMQTRLGDDAARAIVRAHDAAVRQGLGDFNGREVKHTGDGMMAAFGSAADAVHCALAVKRDIATYNDTHQGEELLVRFGLNAGEPIAEDDDLFGLSVTLAARIGDWGEPGQVLCSNVVRELLLGKGFAFTSVGSAELKGLDEPVPLYEVS